MIARRFFPFNISHTKYARAGFQVFYNFNSLQSLRRRKKKSIRANNNEKKSLQLPREKLSNFDIPRNCKKQCNLADIGIVKKKSRVIAKGMLWIIGQLLDYFGLRARPTCTFALERMIRKVFLSACTENRAMKM